MLGPMASWWRNGLLGQIFEAIWDPVSMMAPTRHVPCGRVGFWKPGREISLKGSHMSSPGRAESAPRTDLLQGQFPINPFLPTNLHFSISFGSSVRMISRNTVSQDAFSLSFVHACFESRQRDRSQNQEECSKLHASAHS